MSKRGKYQKRPFWAAKAAKPAKASEKKPEVRNVLLQTYFTSLLCLVLCVTMFFGTSYAWFTSEVTNTGNEIYIGTLDVGLFKETDSDPISLAGNSNQLFDGNIRWEPGYTALETIQIVNEGDLAFDYELLFTDGKGVAPTGSDLKLEDVAKYFDVWVYNHYNKEDPNPTSYSDITKNDSGWIRVGTLDIEQGGNLNEILAGTPVLKGVMSTVRKTAQTAAEGETQNTEPTAGPTDSLNTTDRYTIALHMREDADASVMGHRIGLNVKLVAYQRVQEQDGFGQGEYDEFTTVNEAEALKNALHSSQEILMVADVNLDKESKCVVMNGGVLDGNNKTIAYEGERNAAGGSVGVVTTYGGTIRNLTIEGGENGRALYITKLNEDLNVSNCTFSGAYAFNLNSAENTDYVITFSNTTFKSWTSYANAMKHAYFIGCKFEDTLKPYGSTTLTDCSFTNETLDLSELEEGEYVNLINCTYKGVAGINVELKVEDGKVVVIGGNGLVEVSDQNILVLKK